MRWSLRNDRPVDDSQLLNDRYTIGEAIGQGRSTVYRGKDTRLGREVAVKRVPLVSDHESRERVRVRALIEARAAARLDNPGVVAVYDVVEEDGALWLIMELVNAPSLSQLVAETGPLDHAEAARIGLELLGALNAAHSVDVIHRDVKPANVLVPVEGHVKLADFGVATMRDETRVTATGLVLGSPAYMAPEQAKGEEVGPAADLWALGATLYYAYEGQPPFDGGSALATASAVVLGEPRTEKNPGALSPLVARLLSKTPGDRPEADELKVELKALARTEDDEPRTAPTAVVPLTAPEAPSPSPSSKAKAKTGDKDKAPGPDDIAAAAALAELEAEIAAEAATKGTSDAKDEPATIAQPSASGGGEAEKVTEEPQGATKVGPAVMGMAAAAPPEADEVSSGGRPPAQPGQANRTRVAAIAAVAVLLVVALFVVFNGGGDDGNDGDKQDDDQAQAQTPTTEAEAEDAETTTTAEPEETTTTTEAPTTTTTAAEPAVGEVPDGWQTFENSQAGYTVGFPPGWERQSGSGPRIRFRDPESGSYLMVDWTAQPKDDPVADWQDQSQTFASDHSNYNEISIARYSYRDYNAAGWEFTYSDGGADLHVMNLGFVTGGKGYALYFQTKQENWEASQTTFDQIRQAFQPG